MNEPDPPAIVSEVSGSIAIVRFNRPSERNPLSNKVLDNLDQVVRQLSTDERISAIIFTGSADVFLSGANIRELATLDQTTAREFSLKGQRLMQHIADLIQTTIAAINGYCMGGGLDLALACDIRIASSTAVFAHPGARLGIITGWGGTQRLPRLIGKTRAIELFGTARVIQATEAQAIGLVQYLETPPLDFALELAQSLSS
jgi:enoyl-CoA hydratase